MKSKEKKKHLKITIKMQKNKIKKEKNLKQCNLLIEKGSAQETVIYTSGPNLKFQNLGQQFLL